MGFIPLLDDKAIEKSTPPHYQKKLSGVTVAASNYLENNANFEWHIYYIRCMTDNAAAGNDFTIDDGAYGTARFQKIDIQSDNEFIFDSNEPVIFKGQIRYTFAVAGATFDLILLGKVVPVNK